MERKEAFLTEGQAAAATGIGQHSARRVDEAVRRVLGTAHYRGSSPPGREAVSMERASRTGYSA